MAVRGTKAKETFTVQMIRTTNAMKKTTLKFPGVIKVKREYAGGADSNKGDWIQLCPNGLFFQPSSNMTAKHKDGRTLLAQWDDLEILETAPCGFDRIDYIG